MRNREGTWLAAALLTLSMVASARAEPLDLHAQWDQRCSDCHGHAGEFARRWLTLEQGRLSGRHHRDDLQQFLLNHYLADDLVEPVMQMLAAQVVQAPAFKDRCARCHGTAAEFARRSLDWRSGGLYGRSSGRLVSEQLKNHGGLTTAEIAAMVETLERVHREVSSPAPSGQ